MMRKQGERLPGGKKAPFGGGWPRRFCACACCLRCCPPRRWRLHRADRCFMQVVCKYLPLVTGRQTVRETSPRIQAQEHRQATRSIMMQTTIS